MITSVMKPPKMPSVSMPPKTNNRKRPAKITVSEPKNTKLTKLIPKAHKTDVKVEKMDKEKVVDQNQVSEEGNKNKGKSIWDALEKYPILKDDVLIQKFLKVSMTNNQKGRIRQQLRDTLKGASETLLPEIIHHKMRTILKTSPQLNDTDLRKLRILHNMLKTAAMAAKSEVTVGEIKEKPTEPKKKEKHPKQDSDEKGDKKAETIKKEAQPQKIKGPKRYVVFIGNLPLNITKEAIKNHFWEMNDFIKDVRIPKQPVGKKKAIAYVEFENEPCYELALSKHHSMLCNRRINVLYSTQKNSKITKSEAKGKAAKMVALQKTGKLIGSVPANRKRSHRRKIQKLAKAKENAENEMV